MTVLSLAGLHPNFCPLLPWCRDGRCRVRNSAAFSCEPPSPFISPSLVAYLGLLLCLRTSLFLICRSCACFSLVLPLPVWLSLSLSLSLSFSHCLCLSLPRPCSTCLAAGPDEWDHASPCCPHNLLHGAEGGQEDLCAVSRLAGEGGGSSPGQAGLGILGTGTQSYPPWPVVPLWRPPSPTSPACASALLSLQRLPWPGWLT